MNRLCKIGNSSSGSLYIKFFIKFITENISDNEMKICISDDTDYIS